MDSSENAPNYTPTTLRDIAVKEIESRNHRITELTEQLGRLRMEVQRYSRIVEAVDSED